MNVSYRWLTSLAPSIEGTPREIADRLGMLGAPVDEMSFRGEQLNDILIARVEEVRPHPNADRLRLCTVDAGGERLQVVCGAANVVAGGSYPFAPIGATLPGGMRIRRAKIRGEASEGMLCSAAELGLGRDHSGILSLAGEWRPGSRLVDELEIDDAVLTLDITPNRPELLSHVGVARELAPGGVDDIRFEPFSESPPDVEFVSGVVDAATGALRIEIDDPADCPRYIGAIIDGIRVGPSPEWLATRLRAVGVRPINNVVDATNYILQELGQPLHAFDLTLLEGPMVKVRRAAAGERIRTLDGVVRELDGGMLVIADRTRPIALAGVMGGEETEVTGGTTRILIECAVFDPRRVRATAQAVGLATDASHRYERGIDVEMQRLAVERVVDLITATAGGMVAGPALDVHPRPHRRTAIDLRTRTVRQVLGTDLSPEEIRDLLRPIGFEAEADGDALRVVVPPYRPDVTREIDLIEEVARRRGYDTFDAEMAAFRPGRVPTDPLEAPRRALDELFQRWGFFEARTAAFAPASESRVPLLNPLSSEESHLRDSLLVGLLRRVEHNWAHGVRSIRLYEIGSVFAPSEDGVPNEEVRFAAVLTGHRRPEHWSEAGDPYQVWDLKGLLMELAGLLGGTLEGVHAPEIGLPLDLREVFMVRSRDGRPLGYGGRVQPTAIDPPAWADPVWGLELVMLPVEFGAVVFRDLPSFPPVDRDIALLVPADVASAMVEQVIGRNGGGALESLRPFDVYEGEGIPQGTRSIAWRLRFRDPERTLTDSEVEGDIQRIIVALREELGVERR